MEFVEGDASVRQFLAYSVDEGRRHVDADRLDLLGWAAMRVQIVGQFFDGLGIATLGDEQHSACERVSGQGDVVVAARTRRLIDGQCGYVAKVGEAQGEVHVALAHRHHAVHRITKKIAYESQLDGVPVVPIQALTATLYVVTALLAVWLYLHGWFAISLITAMGITQLWRVYSETLRADHRGASKISVYQILALATAVISALYAAAFRGSTKELPNLVNGLEAIWSVGPLLALQILGLIIFYYTGRSEVTQAQLRIHVCHDKT